MNKRLLLLFGYAIAAVIVNHALYWATSTRHVWAEPFPAALAQLPGISINAILLQVMLAVKKLATFCVPAFLFASGYFAAYSGRKTGTGSQTKVILNRVLGLLAPYLVWSIVLFFINPFKEDVSLGKMAARLVYGGAVPEYYFIPLLIQFTILAPFLVDWARNRSRTLLIVAAAMQLGVAAFTYASVFIEVPYIQHLLVINRTWSLFPTWAFFFPLGMVVGFHVVDFNHFITRNRTRFLVGMVIFGLLSVLESAFLEARFDANWRDSALTIPTTLYALCAIAVFLAFDFTRSPISKPFAFLSGKTMSIYLIHPVVMHPLIRLVNDMFHPLSSFPYLFLIVLIVFGLGVPVLILTLARKLFSISMYKYVFG